MLSYHLICLLTLHTNDIIYIKCTAIEWLEALGSVTSWERNLHLDKVDSGKLREIKIARKAPFGRMKRDNTINILNQIHDITKTKSNLPKMEDWLQKKSNSMIGRGFATTTTITFGTLWSPASSVTTSWIRCSPGSVNEKAGRVLLLNVPSGNDQLNVKSL